MTISQRHVRARRLPAFLGQQYDVSHHNEEIDFVNAHPQAAQITALQVNVSADDREYQFEVNGVAVKFTTPSSGNSTASIASGLAEAANADPIIRGQVAASSSGDTVTLTGLIPGVSFSVSASDANLGAPNTAQNAATAAPIPFGRLCIAGGESAVSPYGNRLGRLASADGLVAQSITLAHGGDTSTVVLQIDGELYEASAATAADFATAINSAVPENTVTAVNDSGDVTITVDTAGDSFRLVSISGNLTISAQESGDTVAELAIGVSLRAYDEEGTAYPPNAGVAALRRGGVWVEVDEPVDMRGPVYVQLEGDNAGKLYPKRAAGRAIVPGLRWFKDRSTDGLAVVECDF